MSPNFLEKYAAQATAPVVNVGELQDLNRDMLAMLEEIGESDGTPGGYKPCPFCTSTVGMKHAPDCRLAALLKRAGREA